MRLGVRQSDIQLDAFSLGMAIVSIACQLMAHLRRRTLAHTAQHSTVDACERVGTRQIETGTSEYKRAKDQCEGEREALGLLVPAWQRGFSPWTLKWPTLCMTAFLSAICSASWLSLRLL